MLRTDSINHILQLKQNLSDLAKHHKLTDSEVVNVSQKLDVLIVESQKSLMKNNDL